MIQDHETRAVSWIRRFRDEGSSAESLSSSVSSVALATTPRFKAPDLNVDLPPLSNKHRSCESPPPAGIRSSHRRQRQQSLPRTRSQQVSQKKISTW